MSSEKILKILKEGLAKHKEIAFAYLFGSFAKHPEYARDIDIAVFLRKKVTCEFERKLSFELSKKLKKDVEIFVLNTMPLLFLSEVFRTGVLLFSRDEKKRIEFESRKLAEVQEFNEIVNYYNFMRCKRYESG